MSEEPNSQTDIWVMDTSSILYIKHRIQVPKRKTHLGYLEDLVNKGHVVSPPKVLSELTNIERPDIFTAWAKLVKQKAARFGHCQHKMQEAMKEKAVSRCIEHLETSGKLDPADPWVIATALHLRDSEGYGVTVVTDERENYKNARSSLNIAAGAMGFPAINYETLLSRFDYWNDADQLP